MHNHWFTVLFVLSAVLFAVLAAPPAPLWGDIRVMHTWETVPENWESLGPPPAGTMINLHIALKPQREDALIDALNEVSNPRHQRYRAHLSMEQVADLVAPHQDTLEIVHSWLEHHGVPASSISTSHGGGWLTITGVPVSQADELLCASYQLYRHTGANETEAILRTVGYSLPAALHAHVETVAPTTHFASLRAPAPPQTPQKHFIEEERVMNATSGKLARVLSKRYGIVTPSFLRWLYKTESYVPTEMRQNKLGTLGLLDDCPIQTDLTQFMTTFRADADDATFTVVQVNGGGYNPTDPGADGSMQTQYAEAMAYPTPHTHYSTGGRFTWSPNTIPARGDAYLEWLNYLLVRQNIPSTISIPYANPEAEFPRPYARVLCNLFSRLGTRGVSILVASGDYGVGPGDCTDRPNGSARFKVMFPASCPYVTSVGGTTGNDPEVAASLSGGGFSRYFLRPKYQYASADIFFESLGDAYGGLYPRWGRGIPDIAAQAQRFMYIRRTVPYVASGTIFSTSTAAGIFSLLNDYQLSIGQPPLGFLNPWLYRYLNETITDITSGSNPGCNTAGFSAVPGWDPVTGLGTLDFEIMQAVLAQDIDSDSDDD